MNDIKPDTPFPAVIPAERSESRDPGNTGVTECAREPVFQGSRIAAFRGFRDDARNSQSTRKRAGKEVAR
jgi:hypothetical protein